MGARAILKNNGGQAAIEMGLALPFIIFLLYYTINAFYSMHTAHVGQKAAAMSMYQRLGNRAQFAVDDVANQAFNKSFIAVEYQTPDGDAPRRRILLDSKNPAEIRSRVGICREPDCN